MTNNLPKVEVFCAVDKLVSSRGCDGCNVKDSLSVYNEHVDTLPSEDTVAETSDPCVILGSGDGQLLPAEVCKETFPLFGNVVTGKPFHTPLEVDKLNLPNGQIQAYFHPSNMGEEIFWRNGNYVDVSSCDPAKSRKSDVNAPGTESDDRVVMCDKKTMRALFRCEACQEVPLSSETVHTCELGHQFCGNCYRSELSTCTVCKGHMSGVNIPMGNVLRKLRQNYPNSFSEPAPVQVQGLDHLSRFYSLKPLKCPQDGCNWRRSARSLHEHFSRDHADVPALQSTLYQPHALMLPQRTLSDVTGNVVAMVSLRLPQELAARLCADTMTCWVHCGAVPTDDVTAVVLWVSCVYDAAHMPPVLYSVQATTTDGRLSFAGQMTPLLDYKDPQSVLATGKCFLYFFKDANKHGITAHDQNMAIELTFYLG